MKKIVTTITLALSVSLTTLAQITFTPATSNTDGTYSYNFGEIVQNTEQTSTNFIPSGLPAGSTYTASILSWGFKDGSITRNSEEALFKLADGECGNYLVFNPFNVSIGKRGITISFAPQQMMLESYYLNTRTEMICPNLKDYFGEYTATVKIDVLEGIIGTPKSFRTADASYTLNITGTSVATTTAIDFSVFDSSKTLAYPNPAKDILYVNGAAEIFDLVGNKVASGTSEIKLDQILSGIYVVKSNGKSQRIVKE